MLEFVEKKKTVRLLAKDDDIEVSIYEENPWNRKKRKESDKSLFRISVSVNNDENYNAIDLCCETLEEAKMVAQDAAKFFKTIQPALSFKVKDDIDFDD